MMVVVMMIMMIAEENTPHISDKTKSHRRQANQKFREYYARILEH